MTQTRKTIVDPMQAASYHCIARCVGRAQLCGFDHLGKSFEHRKAWIEERILQIGKIFACDIYAFAVMRNQYHLVVHMKPATAELWTAEQVALRWVKLYPTGKLKTNEVKAQAILANAELIELYRRRLSDLSWLMKAISEAIARRANAEDRAIGRFWQGRFKCQLLPDQTALQAAKAHVERNPIRAK